MREASTYENIDDVIETMRREEEEGHGDGTTTPITYQEYVDRNRHPEAVIIDVPPRFGMRTSNMSESFNNVISPLRNLSWYQILDGYVSHVIKQTDSTDIWV